MNNKNIEVIYIPVNDIKNSEYNPRKHSKEMAKQLKQSISKFGLVDPIICNFASNRMNIAIGGHFRLEIAKELGMETVPVVYVNIPDIEKEKELNIRLNKNVGEFDLNLLAEFDESLLEDIGFSSEELDGIFPLEENPEEFDIKKELEKLKIDKIEMKEGDVYDLDGSRLMVGDSTKEEDVLKLYGKERADMCFTDQPYILNYLKGKKKHGKAVEGFGLKRDRKYIGTDSLPDDFMAKWMGNIHKVQKESFSIIAFESWKNLKDMWLEMEKHWKINNLIIWHCPNRVQGFAAKNKFFSKYDFALAGSSANSDIEFNTEKEEEGLQNEYETALFAVSSKPHWEGYKKGTKYCPTDHVEFNTCDEKSSGQGIIFGTKPIEILIPYIKVLTRRDDLIAEPFGGSGSTLIAATKLKRRCFVMEKCPIYAEVIRNRWEKLTGKKAIKIN